MSCLKIMLIALMALAGCAGSPQRSGVSPTVMKEGVLHMRLAALNTERLPLWPPDAVVPVPVGSIAPGKYGVVDVTLGEGGFREVTEDYLVLGFMRKRISFADVIGYIEETPIHFEGPIIRQPSSEIRFHGVPVTLVEAWSGRSTFSDGQPGGRLVIAALTSDGLTLLAAGYPPLGDEGQVAKFLLSAADLIRSPEEIREIRALAAAAAEADGVE